MNLFLLVIIALAVAKCNHKDHAIFARRGGEFPTLFRGFGGITVSKDAYVEDICHATGLTRSCATCYGDAYMCGWSNCKWDCVSPGPDCDKCLTHYKCDVNCNKCTKFIK